MMHRLIWVAVSCLLVMPAGCSKFKKDERKQASTNAAKDHADEPAHAAMPRKVRVDPKVIQAARIRTAPAQMDVLGNALTLSGEIVAVPDKMARVSAPVAGRVTQVFVNEGDRVKQGAPLAVVRIVDLGNVKAAHTAALARATSARANANRLQTLLDKGLAARQELIGAQAEAESLEAQAKALEQQLSVLGIEAGSKKASSELTLRAPVKGVVIARNAIVGQPVPVDASIATIADLSEVWFLARVFEKDLAKLQVGADAEVELNAYPLTHFNGKIAYLGQQIDPVARTVTARIPLTNRDDTLRVGLFGTAKVAVAGAAQQQPAVLVVPRDAITEVGGKPAVFVQHADGDFELHEVVLGPEGLGKVQVLSGLRQGEAVVVDGVFTLKSMLLKSTFAEEE